MSGLLQPSLDVVIRMPLREDQGYIAATWYRSMLGRNRAPHRRRRINAQIDRILDDRSTCALIAASADDHDRILGWLVYADAPHMRVVHYLYVRDESRGRGIARRLIAAAWPGSDARLVLTLKGPRTQRFLDSNRNSTFVSVEEFLR